MIGATEQLSLRMELWTFSEPTTPRPLGAGRQDSGKVDTVHVEGEVYLSAPNIWLWVKTNGWGACTTHFRTYVSGDWDVHSGYLWLLAHGHMVLGSQRPKLVLGKQQLFGSKLAS